MRYGVNNMAIPNVRPVSRPSSVNVNLRGGRVLYNFSHRLCFAIVLGNNNISLPEVVRYPHLKMSLTIEYIFLCEIAILFTPKCLKIKNFNYFLVGHSKISELIFVNLYFNLIILFSNKRSIT